MSRCEKKEPGLGWLWKVLQCLPCRLLARCPCTRAPHSAYPRGLRGDRGVGKTTLHSGIHPSAVILAVPQECRADPRSLPFSEPDSWVPVKKAFLPLFLFSLVSFILMLVSLGAQSFPARGRGALGKQEQPARQQQAVLALLNEGRLLKGAFWETWFLQRWSCL